jgi:hypothetical protein
MPQQPSEHEHEHEQQNQPAEDERLDARRSERAPLDKSRPEDGRDFWRAGQQEDLSAGDEGVDDPTLDDALDDTLDDARDADGARPEDIKKSKNGRLERGREMDVKP